MKLILFDIDGTLVRTAGAGKKSMERSFKKIYGMEDGFQEIQMMGRTDPSILMEALHNHGIEWKAPEVESFRNLYFDILQKEIEVDRPGKRVCPGIRELLIEIDNRPDMAQGILTGNWKTSAMVKLRFFHIDTYFPFGAFADDSDIRDELAPFAMRRFQQLYQEEIQKEDMFIIGDTPADIHCASPHGAKSVAVATGFHTYEQLAGENPHYLFQDLGNLNEVMKIF